MKKNIFTANGSFLLHIIAIVFISCTIANFIFWPWAQFFLGGQALAIFIGSGIAILIGWLREKYGKMGYSKSDMKANWIGFGSSIILNLVIFNFGYGV